MYSAAVSSSRLPVTTITGVSGASSSAMRSASAAPNVGSEWSVRMMSGPKVCSASRNPRSESTRRVAPVIPARRSSRSTSAASSATSSTIRTRTSPVIVSARLLVQEQPVQPDIGDGARERLEVHGLDDVAVGGQAVCRRDVGLLLGRGEHDHRQLAGALVVLEAPQDLQPVHLRELQVEQYHARRDADLAQRMALVAEEEFQGLGSVARDEHLVRERPVLPSRPPAIAPKPPDQLTSRTPTSATRRDTGARYENGPGQSRLWCMRNDLIRQHRAAPEAGLEPATRRLTAGCSTS